MQNVTRTPAQLAAAFAALPPAIPAPPSRTRREAQRRFDAVGLPRGLRAAS